MKSKIYIIRCENCTKNSKIIICEQWNIFRPKQHQLSSVEYQLIRYRIDHLINEQSTIIFHKDSEEPITITKQEKVSKFKERRKGLAHLGVINL